MFIKANYISIAVEARADSVLRSCLEQRPYHCARGGDHHAKFADLGDLMSYGGRFFDLYQQAGIYIGKILKPTDLPIRDGDQSQDR
jgi:hypothetical protein